jgi:nucleotide-binding universal stress UspA family protein
MVAKGAIAMRVLVATDGSEIAGVACAQAMELAAKTRGSLRIVSVVPPPADAYGGLTEPAIALVSGASIDAAIEQHLRGVLEAELWGVPEALPTSTAVLRGRPSTAILDEAHRWGADLVVVGSRGHNPISALLLGSVSQEVVDRSDLPVLVARRPGVDRVLIGVDGAGSSRDAVAFVERNDMLGAPAIKVVSVVAPAYPWWIGVASLDGAAATEMGAVHAAADAAARSAIATTVSDLRALGGTVSGECRWGLIAEQLVQAIATWHADIVVIGSRRRNALDALVLGSVARSVLHHAPSSVLVVHPVPHAEHPHPEHGSSTGSREPVAATR